LETNNLLKAGNTLTQRCSRTATNEVVVKLDLMGMADGQQAGLCHFAKTYSALGVLQDGAERMLVNLKNGVIPRGPRIAGGRLWLRSVWGLDGQSRYSFSLDGKTFTNFGEPYQLAWGNYRGDRIGLYTCRHPNETLNIHHVARPISFETLAKRRRNLPDLGIELPTGLSADGGVLVQKFEQAFGCKRLYKDFTVRVEDEQEIGWERPVREFFFFDEGNPGGKSVFKGFFAVDQILKCLAEFGLCFPL
jgi:hypothetical protein